MLLCAMHVPCTLHSSLHKACPDGVCRAARFHTQTRICMVLCEPLKLLMRGWHASTGHPPCLAETGLLEIGCPDRNAF